MDSISSNQTFSCEWGSLSKKLYKTIYSIRPASLASLFKTLINPQRDWVVSNGIELKIDPISHFGQELISTGNYEPTFTNEIISHLKAGDTFLDIGANEGFFSMLAARAVGPTGRVFTVEPQPNLVSIIKENAIKNGFEQIQIFAEAFSETDGEVELNLSSSLNSGASSLFRKYSPGAIRTKVKSERFDEWWINQGKPRFDVVKIDCEGAELFVFRSATQALKTQFAKLMFVDFHESIIGSEGVSEIDFSLRKNEYQLSELKSGVWCYHIPSLEHSILKNRIHRKIPPLSRNNFGI